MSGYDVEPTELYAAGSLLAQAAAEGRTKVDRLHATAEELLAAGWRGRAAEAITPGWREWEQGVRAMLAALDETARALDVTGRDYAQVDESTATVFRVIA